MDIAFLKSTAFLQFIYCIFVNQLFRSAAYKTFFQENFRAQVTSESWIPDSAVPQKLNAIVVPMSLFVNLVSLVLRNFTIIPAVKTVAFPSLSEIFSALFLWLTLVVFCSFTPALSWWVHIYSHSKQAKLIPVYEISLEQWLLPCQNPMFIYEFPKLQ